MKGKGSVDQRTNNRYTFRNEGDSVSSLSDSWLCWFHSLVGLSLFLAHYLTSLFRISSSWCLSLSLLFLFLFPFPISQAFTLSISYLFIGLGFIIIDLFDKFPTAFSFSFLFFTVAVGRMYLRKSFSFSTFGFTRDLFLYFQKLEENSAHRRKIIKRWKNLVPRK